MDKIIISPGKYIQGNGALDNIAGYAVSLGSQPLIIADEFVTNLVGQRVNNSFQKENVTADFELFAGECSQHEIARIRQRFSAGKYNLVIGIGGGKTLDTAKAVAYYQKVPVVIVPTIASTDAPTSSLAVIYTPEGQFSEYLFFPKNPDMVIMDTGVISAAPVRLLVSGMGDALATWFEARANYASGKSTMAGGAPTLAALAIAELCYATLLEDGYKAKVAVEQGVSTKAVENIIEANTYLSGIGFESSGLAAAHAIHNGMTQLEECHHCYHGEKVAFGVLVQLVLENAPKQEIETVLGFCRSIGLPVNLHMLGVKEIDKDKLLAVAQTSTAEGETIHNMPFAVSAQDVYSAILTAHHLGL
ncbi:glycerol dehydrogenase [Citrobacter freundii]|nr:glycerol dehydrogenase [Citrobacter freundii]